MQFAARSDGGARHHGQSETSRYIDIITARPRRRAGAPLSRQRRACRIVDRIVDSMTVDSMTVDSMTVDSTTVDSMTVDSRRLFVARQHARYGSESL
eukprot:8805932-Pyramimonas_sp.AAC.1